MSRLAEAASNAEIKNTTDGLNRSATAVIANTNVPMIKPISTEDVTIASPSFL